MTAPSGRAPTLDIRPAANRFHTRIDWLDSWHSFSFGHHHDPTNVGHGLLIVSNDDRVAPGAGFGTHGHRDMEIVTWVLDGQLEHRDSGGNHGVLYPGLVQRMSAGTGIRHSELNHSADDEVHFIQMWVVPSEPGLSPGYEQADVNDALTSGQLTPVASGQGHPGAIAINQPGAVMYVARLGAGASVDLPDDGYVHLFMARGAVELDDNRLGPGDAARLTEAGTRSVTGLEEAEIIVWASTEEVGPRR